MRKSLPALAIVALGIAGCGSSSNGSSNASSSAAAPASTTPYLASLTRTTKVASTVPANGDVNPYGIVRVSSSMGKETAGDFLISNYNDKENNQGTGTTIDEVSASGKLSLFAQISSKALPGSCPGGVGLTTAMSLLPGGDVVVGSLPTTNGKSMTAKLGCLIVLDDNGRPLSTIAGPLIQGPWDMTAASQGSATTLFVSMALDGGAKKGMKTVKNSTVVRIRLRTSAGQAPRVESEQVVADKLPWRDDPAALVIGPTGLALAPNGTLYVADTLDNRIAAVPDAMTRTTPAIDAGATVAAGKHLKQPLGMALAPNGNIITTNAGDGNMVETTPSGTQVAVRTADTETGEGSLFGFVVDGKSIHYVDDGENTLKLLY